MQIYEKSELLDALKELSDECKKRAIMPFELNVIGNFTLLVHGVKKAFDDYTEIDFVGPELSNDIKTLAEGIGLKHNLGNNWLNNDFLLSGTSLNELEFTVGKLSFTDYYTIGDIKLNILNQKDLLKLKIIAIDTALFDIETGDDFTRYKDLKDISILSSSLNIDLKAFIQDLDTKGLIINPHTFKVISLYNTYGKDVAKDYIENYKEEQYLLDYDYDDIQDEFIADISEEGYTYG